MKTGNKIALAFGAVAAFLFAKKNNKVSGVGACKKTRRVGYVGEGKPAVFVSTYGKYLNGSLKGEWVDLTKFDTYDEFMRYLRELHSDERDPEFMMQDFEGYPSSWYYEGGMDRETFNKIKDYYNAFADDDEKRQAFEAYAGYFGDEASVEDFEDRYLGTHEDEYSYIDELIENGAIDPQELVKKEGTWVIDHDALWRYYVNSGDIHGERTDYGLAVWYRGSFK